MEGAFRKWFAPFLSTPLLLARDPFATLALFWAIPLLQNSIYWIRVQYLLYLGTISLPLTLYFGHGDWFTVLYGLRIYWIHLPLIFVFPLVFTHRDVMKALWSTILLTIPMVLLITAQSTTPPSHILNIGPGGSGSSAFAGAAGKFRPSGVFSFTNSVGLFFTFSAAALMSIVYDSNTKAYNNNNQYSKYRLISLLLVVISLIVALPVSISRSLMAGYAVVVIFTAGTLIATKNRLFRLFWAFH